MKLFFVCLITILTVNKSFFFKKKNYKIALNNKAILVQIDQDSTAIKYKNALTKFKKELYSKALEEALIVLSKSKDDKKHSYLALKLIGDIYHKTHEVDKALYFYKKSLFYLKKLKEDDNIDDFDSPIKKIDNSICQIYLKISGNYLKKYRDIKNKPPKKVKNKKLTKHLLLKNKDSALFFAKKIDSLTSINDEIEKYKAISYSNISTLYFLDSIYDKASFFAQKAIKIHQKRNDKERIASSLNNLANVFLAKGDLKKAKSLYSDAISAIDKIENHKATEFKSILYYNLAWAMRKLEEVEAYDNLEKSYELEDLLKEKDIKEVVKKIEAKHKENLEKQKVDLVKNQIELEKHQKRTTNYLLGALSLLILTISGVVIYNYTLRQRNLHLKIEQNKLVEQQKIAQIKSDSQKMILNAAIDGKETERKQIAETLHDSVSALLSSANMHLLATKRQFNGNTPIELDKTQKIILEASQKVRDLSHNLVSSILLKFGLEYSLQDITQKYSNSELTFHPDMSNIPRYDQDFEIKMYNVIHELINNIIKHSKAANAYIVLEDTGDFLSVLIEDDGVGFNYRNSKVKSGLGLNQIEARIQMMNGNIIIESAENRGTKITMSVPTIKKKEVNLV
ncbi:Signal transduction histidine kinase [Tenacibaculum sp. 190524A02b]|uniref:tetratricopeptide repeat-containing sensor histidine kinase n=1 Tax=Tenacibaculum vairaonense TaxID=3137860 RepID=UPI0032B2A1D2